MQKRVFFNPAINDTATFITTSEESKGEFSLIEIDLNKSDGPPLHYHNSFSEKFEVIQGVLYIQIGKEKKVLNPGESVLVPKGVSHKFYNIVDDNVKFRITLRPGSPGMENFIRILYSLAQDGLTDKKGKPNKFAHLASILAMSDTNASGLMSLLSPIIKVVAQKAKKDGTEKWLLDKYCQ